MGDQMLVNAMQHRAYQQAFLSGQGRETCLFILREPAGRSGRPAQPWHGITTGPIFSNETASDEQAVRAQEDMLLRAVRFLDTMIQRDTLQKAAFLKDLGAIWPRVDARVLKFRLIPPLLAEARTEALQPVLLPLLLAMAEKQEDEVWMSLPTVSLPVLCMICVLQYLDISPHPANHFAHRAKTSRCVKQQQRC